MIKYIASLREMAPIIIQGAGLYALCTEENGALYFLLCFILAELWEIKLKLEEGNETKMWM